MTIWGRIAAALTGLNIPMGADEYMVASGVELPDKYLFYSLVVGTGAQYADNEEKARRHRVQIRFQSRNGLQEADLDAIIAAMIAAGFTHGPDTPLPYATSSRHYCLALDFYFVEE